MHVNHTEVISYETSRTRRILLIIAAEAARTFQLGGVCGIYRATGMCHTTNCNYKHFTPKGKKRYLAKCTVCKERVKPFNGGFLTCGHLLCNTCHINIVDDVHSDEHLGNVSLSCPVCRKMVFMTYVKRLVG